MMVVCVDGDDGAFKVMVVGFDDGHSMMVMVKIVTLFMMVLLLIV